VLIKQNTQAKNRIGVGGGAKMDSRPRTFCAQALLLALPLFCLQIDFSPISY